MKNQNRFDFGDFEITKREILASISIIAVLLFIGFIISGKISDHLMDKNEKYNKAVKIEDQELFEYGMRTDIGNAFVYGNLEAVDTVTYPEIGGKYMYVRKVEEHYTRHTRKVAHTRTVNGKSHTYYTTEVYWSWDYEVLANIYRQRKNHKLDEWREFCKWIETLPYSELIIGEKKPFSALSPMLEPGYAYAQNECVNPDVSQIAKDALAGMTGMPKDTDHDTLMKKAIFGNPMRQGGKYGENS